MENIPTSVEAVLQQSFINRYYGSAHGFIIADKENELNLTIRSDNGTMEWYHLVMQLHGTLVMHSHFLSFGLSFILLKF